MTIRSILCSLGFHKFMDLQRDNETMGQAATEECIHCCKYRYVFRPFWSKDGPMHPRVSKFDLPDLKGRVRIGP